MNPHRPIDLDLFNEEFFSSARSEKKENPPRQIFTDSDSDETLSRQLHPSLTADVIEGLMNIRVSHNGPVFHDLPEDNNESAQSVFSGEAQTQPVFTQEITAGAEPAQPQIQPPVQVQQPTAPSKRVPQISEEEALKSFPAFEFDASLLDKAEEADAKAQEAMANAEAAAQDENSKQSLKAHKEKAKQELRDEKTKIKQQKKLEKKVQKPFRQRRKITLCMVLFLIIGFVAAGAAAVLYMTEATPQATLQLGDYSTLYIDGENIQSSIFEKNILIVKKESVTSSKPVMFTTQGNRQIEELIAIGDGVCAVRIDQDMITIETSSVEGVVQFSIPGLSGVYKTIHGDLTTIAMYFGIYFGAVIILFSALIMSKNRKIKKYRESYQLVS